MNALLLSILLFAPAADPDGVLPVGADGKPLNLDFEAGTLKDWTADGDAFKDQPVKGDAVAARRGDMKSNHQGQFWIGGYEKHGDKPKGTLTSVPFKVTHPWASFLIGGGPTKDTVVELIDGSKKVFFSASGQENEEMARVAVDLAKVQGQEIQIRLVDKSAAGWGHLNFDDFRFHAAKPAVATRPTAVSQDDYKYTGQPPEDAAKNMTVPPGFKVSLFAGEPDLHQPIAMCFDDRGRLWVVEAFCYPKRKPFDGPMLPENLRKEGDKILIFEDTDGDGKFDKRTVFLEGLNLVSGIEYGFGGVWVGAAPYFVFIPILDGDKAGEPKVLLDGWGLEDTHETLNSFIWGPDGWLYGCHGVFTHSNVGKPGTPAKDRTKINAGVWRYHPTKHTFEVFAHGTSNPWGLDYNAVGDFFVEACVIPHLWHIVQGGRYQRQAGPHFNPYTYDDIKTIAKHRHYVGANPHGGNNRSDSVGGGHAHSGLICYQGGTWPKEYNGKLFMGNIHGHRINVDVVTPKGSGYEGDRNPDFLLSNDRTVIVIGMQTGPDGNLYFGDWSDKQVCHRNEVEIWDRTNGRIFKVSHDSTKPVKGLDLQKCSDEELVKYQLHENEWYVRHARRILQERAEVAGDEKAMAEKQNRQSKPGEGAFWLEKVWNKLAKLAFEDADEQNRLRGLWALHSVAGGLTHDWELKALRDKSPHVRAWAIQLIAQAGDIDFLCPPNSPILAKMAKEDPSPLVRRALASGCQKADPELPERRWAYLSDLVRHQEDAADPLLPFLYWYAGEPLCDKDPAKALMYAADSPIPQLLPFAVRRIAAIGTAEAFAVLVKQLGESKSADQQLAILHGLADGMKGRRDAKAPANWAAVYEKLAKSESAEVRTAALTVGVAFRDPAAAASLLAVVGDAKANATVRQNALNSLLDVGHAKLSESLKTLLKEPAMRSAAIRGMARVADDGVPGVLLADYAGFTAAEKRDAITTLASRAKFGEALLDAIEAKKVPSADVPAETIRQLRNLGDKALDAKITTVWGVVRDTPADRKKLIADWKKKLTLTDNPDLSAGRATFAKVCAQCHTLYGVGGKVGPEITGSNRANLDYLLENVFDPSAVIPKEYAATKLDLADGRVITGIIKEETKATLTVVTDRETLTLPVGDVSGRKASAESMMPNDLTKQLTERDVRNLIAYLRHPQQVPMKATAENAKEFFNGKDITSWDGDKDVWSVENGEIVGKTKTGLKKNTFLKAPLEVSDFKLTVKVKLVPNDANSGIQFRSVNIEGGEMRGPQADVGKGWWGKLYEESGRGLLVKDGGEKFVKENDWNEYTVEAIGSTVKIWINGEKVADYTDEKLAKSGLVAFQVHSGGPTEVRFKDIKFEVKEGK
ncbi:PVC-type heme-binding CxxCH protein [Limnoglobus roseus]|uniref:Putative beta-propeller-type and beta-jelly-roll-type glycoside hydrolase n=1 Tax=Limnoglobus roseus TaxID=2598579 RepID=A0A5C1A9Q0_9BACT|nr:PVC-type heme-binding CxxCH protein [Limnoglobus roseus]QEL16099.1 putative beta-propeller-type and beta-jelly-roll-type glycoside hydrolase [Limnoglobus roseus]